MRRILCLLLSVLLLVGCSPAPVKEREPAYTITDSTGRSISLSGTPQRVAAASGSLGEVWTLAGGSLIGATEDAVSERGMDLQDAAVIGSIKSPDLEKLLSLTPDFVILSADIESHIALSQTLSELSVPNGLFHEETFADYLSLLRQFTVLTDREDLYQKNGVQVQEQMERILSEKPAEAEGKTCLLLRAYSSGYKAKGSDVLAGTMLRDFGLINILDKYDSILEDISMEEILRTDPDYIFVTTMGADAQAAVDNLTRALCGDPAWGTLTAVRQENYFILPKQLFHYKPNARWGEAYAYLAELLA